MQTKIFSSTKTLATTVVICLWVGIASDVIGILTVVTESIFYSGSDTSEQGTTGLMALGLLEIANLPLNIISYICTIVFFLMWLNRSYRNLESFNIQGLTATPGWAVGYWFLPILSLFKPLQIVNEVWHGSNSENLEKGYGFSDTSTTSLHGFWWGTWLISGILGQISFRLEINAENPGLNQIAYLIASLTSVFSIIAGFLLITIVQQTTERQEIFGQNQPVFNSPPQPPTFE
jgi:Domain of unknown function (DUF4328)